MRIFVAGSTGALGRRLVPLLVRDGHRVTGATRTPGKVEQVRAAGAEPVVMDVLDRAAVLDAVSAAKPDVVVHQVTALAGTPSLRRFDRYFAATNRLRTTGTDNLLDAARATGARRFVAQSFTGWPNERTGEAVKTEADPIDPNPTAASRESIAAIRYVDTVVPAAEGIDGVVLRYGAFYGPGNTLGNGGQLLEQIGRRRLPVVGGGRGVWSFIHIDDAASATAVAIQRGAPGVYNIVDDEPAPVSEWLPYLARAIGAKPPMRVPSWLVRPFIGEHGVAVMTSIRGSSNAKAKQTLDWQPAYPSWRQGFRYGLG